MQAWRGTWVPFKRQHWQQFRCVVTCPIRLQRSKARTMLAACHCCVWTFKLSVVRFGHGFSMILDNFQSCACLPWLQLAVLFAASRSCSVTPHQFEMFTIDQSKRVDEITKCALFPGTVVKPFLLCTQRVFSSIWVSSERIYSINQPLSFFSDKDRRTDSWIRLSSDPAVSLTCSAWFFSQAH